MLSLKLKETPDSKNPQIQLSQVFMYRNLNQTNPWDNDLAHAKQEILRKFGIENLNEDKLVYKSEIENCLREIL